MLVYSFINNYQYTVIWPYINLHTLIRYLLIHIQLCSYIFMCQSNTHITLFLKFKFYVAPERVTNENTNTDIT